MTPLEALVLISVMTMPPIACRLGYRRGQEDAIKRFKSAESIRLRYCQCRVQSDAE